jgi:uncharacterized protein
MLRAPGILLAVVALALGAGAPAQDPPRIPLSDFGRATVRIATHAGRVHRFDAYVARSTEEKIQGLMYVEELPADAGMLFPYAPPRRASIWMKNTLIPLDLVFVAPDGRIESIVASAEPETLDVRRSQEAVAYVLELNGGTAERLAIRPGARVQVDDVSEP